VTSIGDYAFSQNQLTSVVFRGDRPSIDSSAFDSNPALTKIEYCAVRADWPGISGGIFPIVPSPVDCDSDGDDAEDDFPLGEPDPNVTLYSAILPSSRSVQLGNLATVFATVINAGTVEGKGCFIAPITSVGADFFYQTTDSATNQLIGTRNQSVSIAPGSAQSFVIGFEPTGAFAPTDVELSYRCLNSNAASVYIGLNTLLLSASASPIPDIVALAATTTGDGIADISGETGTGAFAVATVNVGAGSSITVMADTGSANLPVDLFLCETDPASGQCISAIAPSVTTTIAADATPTFTILIPGTGNVPFDPANNRVFVRFKDDGGVTRGSTSVAVRTDLDQDDGVLDANDAFPADASETIYWSRHRGWLRWSGGY
jgi:hypothetical protein